MASGFPTKSELFARNPEINAESLAPYLIFFVFVSWQTYLKVVTSPNLKVSSLPFPIVGSSVDLLFMT